MKEDIKVHINQDGIEYMIHMQNYTDNIWQFQAYPVYTRESWAKETYGKKGISYRGMQSSEESYDELNDKCLMHLNGSVCRRWCRESRVYFTDDEYRWDEIGEIYILWKLIYPILKEKVCTTCKNAQINEE